MTMTAGHRAQPGPLDPPGWEAPLARWLPRLALAAALGVGGLWALSTKPAPYRTAPSSEEQEQEQQKQSSSCDCGDATPCADVSCSSIDCIEIGDAIFDCASSDAIGCSACEVADCAACDCGSCAVIGATGVGTAAAVGASCPRGGGAGGLSLLLLAAPALLLAGWRARS